MRSLYLFLFCVLCVLRGASPAPALEALRPSLGEMSKKISKLLKGRNEDSIALGSFTGSARIASSSGPGIKKILIEELDKIGVHAQKTAELEIKCDYLDVVDKDSKVYALLLRATILNRQGEEVVVISSKIENQDVLAQIMGVTRPDPILEKLLNSPSRDFGDWVISPRVFIHPERKTTIHVESWRYSPYAIEIQVKADDHYRPVVATEKEGLAYVSLKRGETFAINVTNHSPYDAAVALTLDGLSLFAFSENKDYRHVLVGKNSSKLIKGWHLSNKKSAEFEITEYAKSAVAESLANPDNIGTITASFSAAWDPDDRNKGDEDLDESLKKAALMKGEPVGEPTVGEYFYAGEPPDGVGRGKETETNFKEVSRLIGRTRDIISVRYQKPEK